VSTRTYRQVTEAEPAVVEYLIQHRWRLGDEPPRKLWVAEEDGAVIGALVVWAGAFLSIAVVLPPPAPEDTHRPFLVFMRLLEHFERWAREAGLKFYTFAVHHTETALLNIARNGLAEEIGRDDEGYTRFLRLLSTPLRKPKEAA